VIILGQEAARHFWPGENPIGKVVRIERGGEPGKQDAFQVVGIVRDVKYEQLGESTLMTGYIPVAQSDDPSPNINYEVRIAEGSRPAESIAGDVRAAIAGIDRGISLDFASMETQVSDSLLGQRLLALLSAFFGLLALCLAVTGLYGLVTYMTTRRRNEIGIRVALGARYGSVLRLVFVDVAWMLGIGVIAGIAASLAIGRVVASLCYGITPADIRVLGASVFVLAVTTGVAGYLPARRAARMDPIAALREE
jgi:hypothetical protein